MIVHHDDFVGWGGGLIEEAAKAIGETGCFVARRNDDGEVGMDGRVHVWVLKFTR